MFPLDDVIMASDYMLGSFITLTPQWARWRLKSPASGLFTQLFIQVQIKENFKAPRHWPLWGEFTSEFPAQKASNAENVSIWWRHYVHNATPSYLWLNARLQYSIANEHEILKSCTESLIFFLYPFTDPVCGRTVFTETSGILQSPDYPFPYPHNLRCLYEIQVPDTMVCLKYIYFGLLVSSFACVFNDIYIAWLVHDNKKTGLGNLKHFPLWTMWQFWAHIVGSAWQDTLLCQTWPIETVVWESYPTVASCQIYKVAGCACAGNAGNVFPATDFKGNRELAIPACITARAWSTCRDAYRNH